MDAAAENGANVNTPFSALLSSLRAPTPKGAALLSDFGAITPTVVYTGPTRTAAELANLSAIETAAPHHKKKAEGKTAAAKPADEKADAKTAGEKPAADAPKKKPRKAAKAAAANKPGAAAAPAAAQ